MAKKVTKAIIPAAGLGTRVLPISKAMPKEMLPIVDKPAIQYIVEEAVASGIQDGENLLTISEPKISSNIKSKLPYADKIRIGIKLPDTVKIEIVELDVVYSVEASDGSWWLIRSDGGVVEKTNSADAGQHTKILGVKIADPESGKQAVAWQPQSDSEKADPAPVTVLASEQLGTAISIAQFLEGSGLIGEMASIDVSDLGDLEMWYG